MRAGVAVYSPHTALDAVAGGNNDPALAAVARPGACHVVELSSFQLERCPSFAPDVAVLLNLGERSLRTQDGLWVLPVDRLWRD